MKACAWRSAFAVTCFVLGGCRSEETTVMPASLASEPSLALKAIQEREFEKDKQTVFASTVSVLQNIGYTIRSADYNAGLIFADAPKDVDNGSYWLTGVTYAKEVRLTAFVNAFPRKTIVRLSFVETKTSKSWWSGKSLKESMILEPSVYEQIFDKIGEDIFLREGMN